MAKKKTPSSKQNEDLKDKKAYTDLNFFYQLESGGAHGWNDRCYPEGHTSEHDGFYLKYYGAPIAHARITEQNGDKKTELTVFADPKNVPVPADRKISKTEWKKLHSGIMEAITDLRIHFADVNS